MVRYFAAKLGYSDGRYTKNLDDGSRQVILATVAVGRVKDYGTQLATGLKVAPSGFDSVCGGPHKTWRGYVGGLDRSSVMHVVYDTGQSYPQWLVTYRVGP